MPPRLRLAWIEQKPKRVHFVRGHARSVRLTPEQEACLLEIRARIESGQRLPPFCYRVNRDSSADDLLEREGIMHVHLSADDRGEILFLVQYERNVVFLEVASHAAFRDDPPGSYLARLHQHALAELEGGFAAEDAGDVAGTKERIRRGLRPKQDDR